MSATLLTRPVFLRTTGIVAASATAYAGYSTLHAKRPVALAEQAPSDTQAGLKKMAWSGFTELKLQSSELVNHNVKKLTFALSDEDVVSGLAPITSLLSKHTPAGSFLPVIRPYTPIISTDAGTITFLIKKYPLGKGSGKMHSLVPGDSMSFRTLHEFEYTPNAYPSITLVAGGSGITPIFQLCNAILSNPADHTKLSLVYANNSPEDILLRHEFDRLESQYPDRFRAVYTVSTRTGPSGLEDEDPSLTVGYVTKALLQSAMASDGPGAGKGKVLVSGPPAMTEAVAGAKGGFGWTQGSIGGILKELGYAKEDVHKF